MVKRLKKTGKLIIKEIEKAGNMLFFFHHKKEKENAKSMFSSHKLKEKTVQDNTVSEEKESRNIPRKK